MTTRARVVKTLALALGFDRVGIGPTSPPTRGGELLRWLAAGYAGDMGYLGRRAAERLDPGQVLPGARAVICVAMNYYQGEPAPDPSWSPVARYAWGRDYHDVMRPRLERLAGYLEQEMGARAKAYVDTGPLLERDLAARAGLGWIGKNTMLLHPALGSWFFIGIVLTTADLELDDSLPDRCGRCRACLDACPTEAFVAPYVLDARRCISYLTIEHRGAIDAALQAGVGQWEFGCDVCQSVCPWNRKAPVAGEREFFPVEVYPGADAIVAMDDAEFVQRFRGTALMRARAAGMRRNAANAIANRRGARHVEEPGGGNTA